MQADAAGNGTPQEHATDCGTSAAQSVRRPFRKPIRTARAKATTPIFRVPPEASEEMIAIGAALLAVETGIAAGKARRLASELYREMVKARPAPPPPAYAGLTERMTYHFEALHDLTDALGRYPSGKEWAEETGTLKQNISMYRAELRKAGYIRTGKEGRITWLRPRG